MNLGEMVCDVDVTINMIIVFSNVLHLWFLKHNVFGNWVYFWHRVKGNEKILAPLDPLK